MLGPRIGPRITPRIAPSIGGSEAFDLLIGMAGQSNITGAADFAGTGGAAAGATGSDRGYNIDVQDSRSRFDILFATAPTNPMAFVDQGTGNLRAYAAAGGSNMGVEQTLGRDLIDYGAVAPGRLAIAKCAVSASSLPAHWAKASAFPASGEKLYTTFINRMRAMQLQFGRALDVLVWGLGETDSGTPARVTSAVADLTTFFSNVRADLGAPNLAIFALAINPAQAAGDVAGYRAQQVAYAAIDPLYFLVETSDIPLHTDPHYDSAGYQSLGSRLAVRIARWRNAAVSLDLGAGPVPWYQQTDPGFTAQASPSRANPRSGADAQDGDIEILIASGFFASGQTITLTTAAGFVQHGSQINSTFTTSVRSLAVFTRPVTTTILDANGGRMPTPTVDFGTSTLNVARIFCIRGGSAINTSSTGANNANTAALSIAGGTTTVDNCLVFLVMLTAGATNSVSAIVNASLTGIIELWDSRYNPGAGTVGMAVAVGTKAAAGAYGSTAVTFASTGINVGMAIALQP